MPELPRLAPGRVSPPAVSHAPNGRKSIMPRSRGKLRSLAGNLTKGRPTRQTCLRQRYCCAGARGKLVIGSACARSRKARSSTPAPWPSPVSPARSSSASRKASPPGVDPIEENLHRHDARNPARFRRFAARRTRRPASSSTRRSLSRCWPARSARPLRSTTTTATRDGTPSGVPNLLCGRAPPARYADCHARRRRGRQAETRTPRQGAAPPSWRGQFETEENGGDPGFIWKIDGLNGAVSLFTTIEGNSGPGIGDVSFDKAHRQFFASDLDTGLIHRIDANGAVIDNFDHGVAGRPARGLAAGRRRRRGDGHPGAAFDSEDPDTWGYTQDERRVWAVAVHGGRVYYAVGDKAEIWSIGLTQDGAFDGDPRWELTVDAPKRTTSGHRHRLR